MIIKFLKHINAFYQKQFFLDENIQNYVKDRGVFQLSIEKFEIGYASSSNSTIDFLKSNHYNLNDAIEQGVISQGENGLYARFIDRLIFPIYSINGKTCWFWGKNSYKS